VLGPFPLRETRHLVLPVFLNALPPSLPRPRLLAGRIPRYAPHSLRHRLRRDALTPHSPEPAYASEDRNRADTRDCRPIANHPLRPGRDRNSPDMFSLADQVGDDPMSFRICRSSILRPTSSARRSLQPIRNARIARSRLPRVVSYGKPCSNVLDRSIASQFPSRRPRRFAPLTRRMTGSQFRAQQASIGRLVRKPPDRI
jgi:hypothetical protein